MKERESILVKIKGLSWVGGIAWLLFLSSGFYGRLIPAPVRIEYIALLSLIIIMTQQAGATLPILENRFLTWLGVISYELYISHILVIILISSVYAKAGIEFPSYAVYLACTMVAISVAWCFHFVCFWVVDKFK